MPNKLDEELVKQIRNELQFSETADLVEIWQTNDPGEWTAEGFEAVRGLLVERLGPIPPREKSSSWTAGLELRAQHHLDRAKGHEAEGKFEQALTECEAALQLVPNKTAAHTYRGVLLDLRAQRHLDEAEALATEGNFEQALAECEAALQLAPNKTAAHNFRGVLLEGEHHVLAAMDAYRTALRLDPQFSEARENLRAAEREWRDDDSPDRPPGPAAPDDPALSGEYMVETGELPAELYLSEASRILPGWPGYRTRPGRSGYDYMDTVYEQAHMEGVLLRLLFTGKLRTRSWVGLISLVMIGLLAILPLFFARAEFVDGRSDYLVLIVILVVIWLPGLLLLWNVALNVRDLLRDQ